MKIEVKESMAVKPAPARPRSRLWISNVDDVFLENYHTRTHSFYRPTAAAADFFNTAVLKAALARTLSEFYPVAGRLSKDENGRVEIDCNGEGAILVEAAAYGEIDDLGDFAPRSDISLAPQVDYSLGISSFPLLLVQVTRFKCGGVCLGVTIGHKVQDGISSLHLLTRWGDIARGLDVAAIKPHFDRRVLAARNPLQPKFDHIEFHPPPPLKNPPVPNSNVSETKFSVFKLTRQQLNILKENCNEDDGKMPLYSSFEALTGHAWKCLCKARRLEENQETRLIVMVDGRSRLRPPLLPGYFGNVTFKAAHIASSGEIGSNPLKFTARKVHEALARMDDEYLRSAIDYLEVQGGLGTDVRGSKIHKSPNMGITSWAKLPLYDVDFGWGRPFYVGLGFVPVEGHLILMPAPVNDGGLSLVIALPVEEMKLFETSFYEMVSPPSKFRCS